MSGTHFKLQLPVGYLLGPVFITLILVVEYVALNHYIVGVLRWKTFHKDFMN